MDHSYQTRWPLEQTDLPLIPWDAVWKSVHNNLFTEKIKSTIWEQIHLNFYTTYNYMIWHNKIIPCPLCNKIPEDVFHILLDCAFIIPMWRKIEPVLVKIISRPLSKDELFFGIQPRNSAEENATVLRNWITVNLRNQIMQEERKAHYFKTYTIFHKQKFLQKFNKNMQTELTEKQLLYTFRGLQEKFDNIISVNNVIQQDQANHYVWQYI